MEAEADTLAKYIVGSRVIDIGCGIGVMAALLAQRGFEVTAVDRQATTDSPRYGDSRDFYTDLNAARAVFAANGVSVRLLDDVPDEPFDTAISLYAMGFHFPLDTYAPRWKRLICDLRGDAKGKVIAAGLKSNRCIIDY